MTEFFAAFKNNNIGFGDILNIINDLRAHQEISYKTRGIWLVLFFKAIAIMRSRGTKMSHLAERLNGQGLG